MRRRRISPSKQKHELRKYLRQLKVVLFGNIVDTNASIESLTFSISDAGVAEVYLPSREYFEKIGPQSQPAGMIFSDDSFLVFYEIIRYGYPSDEATSPVIYRPKYSYHYQRPIDHFYFRYDKHPDVGEPETHPLHHLHSAGWSEGATKLQDVPRYPVSEVTLEDILPLILISFPSVMIG